MKLIDKTDSIGRNRLFYGVLILVVIATGVLWRSRFVTLPPFLTKYSGDALWAVVVFFGFGFLFPKITTARLFAISLAFAWAIEFSQLYHAPWIDSIRAARLGHLVLGSTFNWPDLAAYAVGAGLGAVMELGWRRGGISL